MKLEFGFGTGVQEVIVNDSNVMDVLHANEIEISLQGEEEVRRALQHPIGASFLREVVHPGETIAIVTSDITRPLPSYLVLPPILEELEKAGVAKKDITIVFGLGSHRNHTPAEIEKLVGKDIAATLRCEDSNSEDCINLGITANGTQVDVSRAVATANRRICLGNIEYHYFAGYSGGAKAIMPGVSNRAAIQSNHRLMVLGEARAGSIDTNPLRQDIEEAGRICGIDYIVNVVLDEHKKIIKAVAGDSVLAHREGCKFLDKLYRKEIPERADIVLVSQGGAPKDMNLYQTQKALDNAKHAVKEGGIVILIGSCKEGLGEEIFEEWMTGSPSPAHMIERIGKDFQLGGHKAAAIAMVLEKAKIFLVSDLPADFIKEIFLEPKSSAQEALQDAFKELGEEATVLAMPFGGSTLPYVVNEVA